MRISSHKHGKIGVILLVLVLLVAVAAVGAFLLMPGSVKVQAVFRDADGLERGAPVFVEGEQVGTVGRVETVGETSVVTLNIDWDGAKKVHTPPDSAMRLRRGTDSRPASIEIVNRGKDKPSLAADASMEALESKVAEGVFLGTETAEGAIDHARRGFDQFTAAVKSGINDAREWTKGEEAQQMKARVEEIRKDLEEEVNEGGRDVKEALADAMERGKELGEDLREYGREDLIPQLEKMMNEVKETASELTKKDEEK